MAEDLGDWKSHEYHQPRAWDVPFGRNEKKQLINIWILEYLNFFLLSYVYYIIMKLEMSFKIDSWLIIYSFEHQSFSNYQATSF